MWGIMGLDFGEWMQQKWTLRRLGNRIWKSFNINYSIMKSLTILIFLFFSCLLLSFAQSEIARDFNWKIGYGASKGLPNGRYIHNFFLEKQLVKWNNWSLLGEASYFHSPQYWIVAKSDDPIPSVAIPTISDPSKIRLFNLGLKMRRKILMQGSFHIGIAMGAMLGYGYIEREEILTTLRGFLDVEQPMI